MTTNKSTTQTAPAVAMPGTKQNYPAAMRQVDEAAKQAAAPLPVWETVPNEPQTRKHFLRMAHGIVRIAEWKHGDYFANIGTEITARATSLSEAKRLVLNRLIVRATLLLQDLKDYAAAIEADPTRIDKPVTP